MFPGMHMYNTDARLNDDEMDVLNELDGDMEHCENEMINGRTLTVYEYKVQEDLTHPATCGHTFLRIRDNLWVHINFIETEVHIPVGPLLASSNWISRPRWWLRRCFLKAPCLQITEGGTSFKCLEECYVRKCESNGWPCQLPTSSKGEAFTFSFKLHALITILNGSGSPLGQQMRIMKRLDSAGKLRCGMELTIKWAITSHFSTHPERKTHSFDVPGCGGAVSEGAAPVTSVVMDGCEVWPSQNCVH